MNDSALILHDDERAEVVEALESAVAVLGMQFSETEGSGHFALRKCQRVLKYFHKLQRYRTMAWLK